MENEVLLGKLGKYDDESYWRGGASNVIKE
jgi:hypothetical protein